jgi:NAD+ kinase
MSERSVLLVIHPTKSEAATFAIELAAALTHSGFTVLSQYPQSLPNISPLTEISKVEIAIVLGGDGTILRAAEIIQGAGIPILGINMGNVGFLAEIDRPTIAAIVEGVSSRTYHGESRLVLRYSIERLSKVIDSGWALNEVTIARSDSQMVELFVQIDGRPLSRWGCDGVIAATPTGSTAYAFSAGGPVVWPEVHAIVFLPLAAHALFSRPMVISPESTIAIDIESANADLSADGMRTTKLEKGDRIAISREEYSIQLVHLDGGAFTDRLVAKFKLPIEGWRGE